MSRILVTGGAGFIGSHVADALLAAGHDVHVIDDLSGGRRENVNPKANFHHFDIRSEAAADLVANGRFEVMMHLAAQMDVRKSVADPIFDSDVNIRGLLNLMEAGRRGVLKKVVFSSTGGAIYGEPESVPQNESHPLQPLSPYGIAKLASERYLYFYRHVYGIEFVALRYGNVYGPRQNPHGEAGVVAIFAMRMLAGEPVFINGTGEQTRDYVFVEDVVRANMLALGYAGSGIFNVGTGVETSVNALFIAIRDAIDPRLEMRYREAQPGEQKRSVLDYSHSESILGWKPLTDVHSGIRKTVEWFRRQQADQ